MIYRNIDVYPEGFLLSFILRNFHKSSGSASSSQLSASLEDVCQMVFYKVYLFNMVI